MANSAPQGEVVTIGAGWERESCFELTAKIRPILSHLRCCHHSDAVIRKFGSPNPRCSLMNALSPIDSGSTIRIHVPSPKARIKVLEMNAAVIKRTPNLHQTLIDGLVIDIERAGMRIETPALLHPIQTPMPRAESEVIV